MKAEISHSLLVQSKFLHNAKSQEVLRASVLIVYYVIVVTIQTLVHSAI